MCGDFNARTGGLHDVVEDNMFNNFGCDGTTRGLSIGIKACYEKLCKTVKWEDD